MELCEKVHQPIAGGRAGQADDAADAVPDIADCRNGDSGFMTELDVQYLLPEPSLFS